MVISMKDKKMDLRIIKTKKSLYEALLTLMEEKTFEEIKVSDICSKALINRSTFYAHFDDKYTLLADLIQDLKTSLQEELLKNKNITTSKEYYLAVVELLLDHMEEKRNIYTSIMIHNKNSIAMDMIYDTLNEDITKRIKEEGSTKYNNIPREFIATFYLGAILNVGMEWIRNIDKYTREDMIQYLTCLIPELSS